ncbi:anti-sigma factor domain-containing protein [Paenibacillus sp. 2TAB23]|uniref:anti-sigma factor domain-containing protein n=1 Tax=Paenibacillus sp. 2TAB23 TaxID=3233004 RepID=UPI003F98F823
MKRGIVVSIHKQHAVVMTADGQFLQAPIQGTQQLGEEIIFEAVYKKTRNVKPAYWYGSAAAILLVFILPLLFFIQKDENPVVAYVSMDINPSVELGVDENGKVRELRALNADGENIINGLPFEGINVETVAASLLEKAKSSHYLDTPNKDIFITSVLLSDASALKLDYESILTGKVDETLRLLLNNLTEEAATANITTMSIPNEVREEAAINGISSGKMAVYLMAKEEGYALEIEQLKKQSIDKVTEPVGGVKTIVDNAQDKSKEKLKELVAKEKEEKAKQQNHINKGGAAKPTATAKPNKPVKAAKPEKPEKPSSAVTLKPSETKKPVRNGALDDKPVATPGKPNKPSKPDRPNSDKQDEDKKDDDRDWNQGWDQGWNQDWNQSHNNNDNDEEDNRGGNNRNEDRDNNGWGSNWRDGDKDNRDARDGRNSDRKDDKGRDDKSNVNRNTKEKDNNRD